MPPRVCPMHTNMMREIARCEMWRELQRGGGAGPGPFRLGPGQWLRTLLRGGEGRKRALRGAPGKERRKWSSKTQSGGE